MDETAPRLGESFGSQRQKPTNLGKPISIQNQEKRLLHEDSRDIENAGLRMCATKTEQERRPCLETPGIKVLCAKRPLVAMGEPMPEATEAVSTTCHVTPAFSMRFHTDIIVPCSFLFTFPRAHFTSNSSCSHHKHVLISHYCFLLLWDFVFPLDPSSTFMSYACVLELRVKPWDENMLSFRASLTYDSNSTVMGTSFYSSVGGHLGWFSILANQECSGKHGKQTSLRCANRLLWIQSQEWHIAEAYSLFFLVVLRDLYTDSHSDFKCFILNK